MFSAHGDYREHAQRYASIVVSDSHYPIDTSLLRRKIKCFAAAPLGARVSR
jgi:hypothetical protein